MRTYTLAAIALVLGCALLLGPKDEARPEYYKNRAVMDEICDLIDVDCSQVEEPTIVITHLVPEGYYGMYFTGEKYIFISYGSRERLPYRSIEIHEVTHFILHEIDADVTWCESERIARSVTAILTDTEVDPEWAERYGCKKLGALTDDE